VDAATTPVQNFNLIPTKDTSGDEFAVLKFKVTDAGGDSTATLIDRIKIATGGTGGSAATDIAWAELRASDGGDHQVATAASIENDYITFGSEADGENDADLDTIADGTSVEYTVRILMKDGKLTATEADTYIFDTDESLVSVDTGTSSQMADDTGSITPVTGTITVVASYIEIVDSSTGAFSAALTAGAGHEIDINFTDANRNIDEDDMTNTNGNQTLIFTGLNSIGSNFPKVESAYFDTTLQIHFTNGSSTASQTLTAYTKEIGDVSASQTGKDYGAFTFEATVSSADAAGIAYVSGDGQTGIISATLSAAFFVVVSDTYGNPVADTSVGFAVSDYPSGASGYEVSADEVATDADGQASTFLTLGNTRGEYEVSATSTDLSGSPVTFSATCLEPTTLTKVSGEDQSKYAMQELDAPFVIKLQDTGQTPSVPISGQTVNFSIYSYPQDPDATGQELSVPSDVTDADGEADSTLTLGNKMGDYVVKASYGSLTSVYFTATALAGAPYRVVLTGPDSVNAGSASSAFTIAIKDEFDNATNVSGNTVFNLTTDPSSTGAFYSDAACEGSPITQITVADDDNTAAFYYKHTAAATIDITAAWYSGENLTVTSDIKEDFSILPADLNYFTVSGSTEAMTAGGSRVITIKAYDVYDNLRTNYTDSMNVTFSGANSSPSGQAPTCSDVNFGSATSLSFTAGEATSTMKIYKAEAVSVKATSGSVTTSSDNDLNITVKHGSADHVKFGANLATPQTAGAEFNFDTTLDAVDLYGNICDGANSADAYEGSKTITWTLSGDSNGPTSGTDSFTNPVSFTAGQSTTVLSATLYRAQETTLTAGIAALTGTDEASNTITVNPGALSQLSFYQQPSTSCITSQELAVQPEVAVSDDYGNACTTTSAQITLAAFLDNDGTDTAGNGTLTSDAVNNTMTTAEGTGIAAFTGMTYSYPEAIYLKATVSGQSLDAVYSYQITFSTTTDLSTSAVTSGVSDTVSSMANSLADKTNVFAFKVTDAGADGLDGVVTKIIVNTSGDDTTGSGTNDDWTDYIEEAYLTDGPVQWLGTIAAETVTFGDGGSKIYSVADGGEKTYTLSVIVKDPLPAGADGRVLGFTMDANDDISVQATSSAFAAATALADSSTITVVATDLAITGDGAMAAGGSNIITITATDANVNIDTDYDGTKDGMVFSGANAAPSGQEPTCANYAGTDKEFGEGTSIIFSEGVSSSTVTMKLYMAEIAAIAVTDGNISTATGSTLAVTVSGGAASQLSWRTQPVAVVGANAPWNAFVVAITDVYENTASSTKNVTVTPSGGSLGSGAVGTVAASGGLASFTNFYVTCGSYPGLVTLNATADGVTESGASSSVSVKEEYAITVSVKDSVTGVDLTEVEFSVTEAGAAKYGPISGTSPFECSLAYGTYTFNMSKDRYVTTGVEKVIGTASDGADGTHDAAVSWTTYLESLTEATADYRVKPSFVYDEDTEDLTIRLWLERRGRIIYNSDANKLGSATVDVYDETTGTWLNTITLTPPATADYTNGTYVYTVSDIVSAGNDFGMALTSGKTYFAKCKINYGGLSGTVNLYEAGTTFTITITQSLSREIISKIGVMAEGETLVSKIEAVSSQVAAVSLDTAGVSAKVDVVSQKLETGVQGQTIGTTVGAIMEDTSTALPEAIVETAERGLISGILNRNTRLTKGKTITVRYHTESGLSIPPTITLYDEDGEALSLYDGVSMTEISSTGIYEYDVAALNTWTAGDYTVVCSDATNNATDSMILTIKALFVAGEGVEDAIDSIGEIVATTSLLLGTASDSDDDDTVLGMINDVETTIDNLDLTTVGTDARNAKSSAIKASETVNSMKSQVDDIKSQVSSLHEMLGHVEDIKSDMRNMTARLKERGPGMVGAPAAGVTGEEATGRIRGIAPGMIVPGEISTGVSGIITGEEGAVIPTDIATDTQMKELNNKVEELSAMLKILTTVAEEKSEQPVVEGWFETE